MTLAASLVKIAQAIQHQQENKEKQASIGALLGGYAGHKLTGNSNMKTKAIGMAGGALAGHLVGKGLSATKKELLDRQEERERAELYGYTPPPPPSDFY